jgi:3-deoxy-D-manno-octulosonic-acid transferase
MAKLFALRKEKARKWVEGRSGWYQDILRATENWEDFPRVWFQCASLGEFEQARPVIEGLKRERPNTKILLTFYSPSGYDIRKAYQHADHICYMPFDFRFDMELFVELVKPHVAIFTKYDFWLNAFEALRYHKVPLICLSVHVSNRKMLNWPLRAFYRKIFNCVHTVLAQHESTSLLVKQIRPSISIQVTGDTRVDRVLDLVKQAKPDSFIQAWKGNNTMYILGSVWPEDMDALALFINHLDTESKVLIAPHEIDEASIARLMKPIINPWKLASENKTDSQILLLNAMGKLANLYQYADYVWIGGAFKQGLHNILEPAAFGKPVFFGPEYSKFQEAEDLVRLETAFSCANSSDFKEKLKQASTKREEIKEKLSKYFESQRGASQKAVDLIGHTLDKQLMRK